MTISKKLYLSFGVAFALSLALGATALYSIADLSDLLHTAITDTALKQKLAGELGRLSVQLLADDRGIIVRGYMKDQPTVEKYNRQYADESEKIRQTVTTMMPLMVIQENKDRLAQILSVTAQLDDANKAVYDATVAGDMNAATRAYADKFLPVQKQLGVNSQGVLDSNQTLLDASEKSAESSTTSARWITGLVLLLCGLVGAGVVFIVREINQLLRQSVLELGESVGQVASAAGQIASSSQGVAQGASEQAATIEETSASSSEINSMAQRNTENSRTTADMMSSSQTRFAETNVSLQEMVTAMDGITSSSQKISKIIKVIDEIAFQTNILALNAAVEAARAGEAGMGFAVVADEVRNLAQRCAQAAKDTADLIEDSIQKSNGGKAKVDQVAGAFQQVATESSKMKILVDEINLGSVEQARGIDQISRSISQMEQVTQSSAANAEQGAAAAEELSAQSQTMQEIVSRLTAMVDGNSTSGVANRAADARRRPATARPALKPARDERRSAASFKAAVKLPKAIVSLRPAVSTGAADFPLDGDFKEF